MPINQINNTISDIWKNVNPSTMTYTVSSTDPFVVASTKPFIVDDKIKTWVQDHCDEIEDIIEDAKAKKEHNKVLAQQKINKYYRSLVKHVHWSGTTCIVYWSDGTTTKARWNPWEDFDPEKAILVCMARKLYGNTNLYNEVLHKYASEGVKYFKKEWIETEDEDEDYDWWESV